jgi:outer membrane protein TolC
MSRFHALMTGRGWCVFASWRTALLAAAVVVGACQPKDYRQQADEAASGHIEQAQEKALGETEAFAVEPPGKTLRRRLLGQQHLAVAGPASFGSDALPEPEHWPEPGVPATQPASGKTAQTQPVAAVPTDQPLELTLTEALQVAARNNRPYQAQKENVFRAALGVELQLDQFRNTYTGLLQSIFSVDQAGDTTTGFEHTGDFDVSRRLKSGAQLTSRLVLDLAQLLSNGGGSSFGIAYDGSITVPLLRGAGEYIVTEPLTQAKRTLIYDLWRLKRAQRELAVDVVSDYLSVLQAQDRVQNAEQNYRNLVVSQRRAQALFEAGELDRIQLDQNRQQVLAARNRWISEQDTYARALDSFKQRLGLPTDAAIRLNREALDRLAKSARQRLGEDLPDAAQTTMAEIPSAETPVTLEQPSDENAGPLELAPERAIDLALANRLDLKVSEGQVLDAQRRVIVAADALEAGLDLTATAAFGERRSLGSALSADGRLRPEEGFYSAGAALDLPLERTAEALDYRDSFISLDRAVRDVQSLEDQIKFNIRDQLRILDQQRQSYGIQAMALEVAERQVDQTSLSLELGREGVEIRDVLEAEAELLSARNALTAALVEYRVAELQLQRDMGVLKVNEQGLYDEFNPDDAKQ